MAYTNCDLILSVKDAEDHEKWLKTRDLGIGGSDAAVIMGMNSYKSPYQLWMEKTGQVEPPSTMKNPTGAEHPEFLATQTWEAVQHLLDETELYIKGKRAQGNLFESDTE